MGSWIPNMQVSILNESTASLEITVLPSSLISQVGFWRTDLLIRWAGEWAPLKWKKRFSWRSTLEPIFKGTVGRVLDYNAMILVILLN